MTNRWTGVRRAALLFGAAAVLAAMIGGLVSSRATAASPSPASGKTVLKIGWMESPDNMNPFIGWSNNVYEIYGDEYLRFVERDTKTLKPDDKGVAKSWEVSPDGLTWTFKINQGITWHDGQPLTADDVAFTFNYVVDNDMPILGTATRFIKKAVVVDPYTVKIICSQPKANMLYAWMIVLPKHIWSKLSPQYAGTKFQNPPPVIGNGPWQVVDWKRNGFVRLVARKDFYLGPPKIDEVLFIAYQNSDSMVEDFKSGNLDAAYEIPGAQYEPLKKTAGVALEKYTWFNWDYLAFNCYTGKSHGNPVLRDQRFRAALEYAVDRKQIVDVAYNGYALPGYTFMPPGDWKDPDYSWQPPDGVRRDFDIAKANQLLDAAGYRDTNGDGIREYKGKDITLRFWSNNASPASQRASKLIAGWFRQVGVGTTLATYDDGVYFARIWNYDGNKFAPDFDIYLWSWDGYFDAGQTLDCFTTAQIEYNNELAWSNTEFDRLDAVQNRTIDAYKRAEVIKQMQQVMYQDAPVIVITHPYKLGAYRTDKWQGWEVSNYGTGPVFAGQINPWAYYNLQPKTATVSGGGTSSTWIVAIVVAAIVVAVAAFFLVRRGRRGRAEEE
jgi:peptide/nickel transport system substrate-binding protein